MLVGGRIIEASNASGFAPHNAMKMRANSVLPFLKRVAGLAPCEDLCAGERIAGEFGESGSWLGVYASAVLLAPAGVAACLSVGLCCPLQESSASMLPRVIKADMT